MNTGTMMFKRPIPSLEDFLLTHEQCPKPRHKVRDETAVSTIRQIYYFIFQWMRGIPLLPSQKSHLSVDTFSHYLV